MIVVLRDTAYQVCGVRGNQEIAALCATNHEN
jgi:hypothetical protein